MGVSLSFRPWKPTASTPDRRSLWLQQAFERESDLGVEILRGDLKADVCLIGGGFTGLWTAIRLKEQNPSASIVIVEADLCGGGASGRNSGGIGHWWGRLPALLRMLGPERAKDVVRGSVEAVADIVAFIQQHEIDCELRMGLSVAVATAQAQLGAWKGTLAAAQSVGLEAPMKPASLEFLQETLGDGPHLGGMVEENCPRVQPAKLARGLRKVALRMGVKIFENTVVTEVSSLARGVAVKTEQGCVTADQVVLGANAWMAHLPMFRRHIMVLSSDIIYTDPIPDLLRKHGLDHRPGSRNYRLMLNYGGLTPDGRVYLGRGGGSIAFKARVTPDFHWSARQAREVEDDFRFLYPQLRDVPIAGGWAGPIDRSATGLPSVGTIEGDDCIFYAIGYTGHGVGASSLVGRMLASRMSGKHDKWADYFSVFENMPRGSFPPEPIRYIGAGIVREAVLRKEKAEQTGRQPSGFDRSLARFAMPSIPAGKPSA